MFVLLMCYYSRKVHVISSVFFGVLDRISVDRTRENDRKIMQNTVSNRRKWRNFRKYHQLVFGFSSSIVDASKRDSESNRGKENTFN